MRTKHYGVLNKVLLILMIVLGGCVIVLTGMVLRLSDETTALVMQSYDTEKSSIDVIVNLEMRISVLEGEIEDLKAQCALAESLKPPKEYSDVELMNEDIFEPIDDIPLSDDLQIFTHDMSERYDIPFWLLIAVMEQESEFRIGLTHKNSDGTTDIGIMQINSTNWKWLKSKHGLDVNDTYDNIEAGAVMLSDLWARYSPEEALSAYNMGEGGMLKNGVNAYGKDVYRTYLEYSVEGFDVDTQ